MPLFGLALTFPLLPSVLCVLRDQGHPAGEPPGAHCLRALHPARDAPLHHQLHRAPCRAEAKTPGQSPAFNQLFLPPTAWV